MVLITTANPTSQFNTENPAIRTKESPPTILPEKLPAVH